MYAMAAMNAMRTAEKTGDWRMAMELLNSMCHFDILKGLQVVSKSFRFIALLLVIRNHRKNEKNIAGPSKLLLKMIFPCRMGCTNALGVKHECTPLIPQLGLKGECGVTFQRVRVPSVDPLLEFSQ